MQHSRHLFLLGAAALAASYFVHRTYEGEGGEAARPKPDASERIVSLAPSITEVLFALGVGERVVGVSSFCDYPPEAADLDKVGGYYDTNYEAILALRPGVVFVLPSQREAMVTLRELGVAIVSVDHRSLDGICASLRFVGARCAVEARGRRLETELRSQIEAIAAARAGRARPRVLLVVGRDVSTTVISEVYVAGAEGFYNELIEAAGGRNVYSDATIRYPTLSREGLIRLDPDVVIELVPDLQSYGYTADEVESHWRSIEGLRAAGSGRVHVISGSYLTTPGPRIGLVLQDLIRALHPDTVEPAARSAR